MYGAGDTAATEPKSIHIAANAIALARFEDILSVFNELGWGYSLWNFQGDFGIISHNRPGTRWEKIRGFKVDRDMYELFIEHMKEA